MKKEQTNEVKEFIDNITEKNTKRLFQAKAKCFTLELENILKA